MSKRSHDGDAPPQLKAMLDDLKREVMQVRFCLHVPAAMISICLEMTLSLSLSSSLIFHHCFICYIHN